MREEIPLQPTSLEGKRYLFGGNRIRLGLAKSREAIGRHYESATPVKVAQLCEAHGIRRGLWTKHASELYAQFIAHCLTDRQISPDEIALRNQLRQVMLLPSERLDEIERCGVESVYAQTVQQVIAEGRLSEDGKRLLAGMQANLGIDGESTRRIYLEAARALIASRFDTFAEDERISDEEESELKALQLSLGVRLELEEGRQREYGHYRTLWVVENARRLPTQSVDVKLQKNERCYFSVAAENYELRTRTTRVNYAGPTFRMRIAKGVSWRMGSLNMSRQVEEYMHLKGAGTLYLTNKKLLFVSEKGASHIRLNRIVDFDAYQDGVVIQKDTGKPQLFLFDGDTVVFCAMLDRAVGEC